MRRAVSFFTVLLLCLGAATPARAQGRPQFRPAVLGTGPDSLINRIDGAALMKAGQKDGAIMFCSLTAKDGRLVESRTYRPMPDSDALEKEVRRCLEDTKVTPAIYNYQPVEVLFYGTVVFRIVNAKPRVRIYLHQDPVELKKESDFVGPQPIFGGDSRFMGLHAPQEEHVVPVTGIVDLGLKVDAKGNPTEMRIIKEDPPLLGFGAAALEDFAGAKFVPAFRDGDPAECDTVLPVVYGTDS